MRLVFLVGFMATGKTTVGQLVAGALGRRFVDLDLRVTETAGMTIPEIFAREGEPGFRARESAALAALVAEVSAAAPPAVIATGGGTPTTGDNLAVMRAAGLVVTLAASLATSLARAGDRTGRPLLSRRPPAHPPAPGSTSGTADGSAADDEVAALHQARAPVYRRGHATVDTEGRTPAEISAQVVDLVLRAEALPAAEQADAAWVALGPRTYPIVLAPGSLAELGARVAAALPAARRIAVVTDSNVAPLHGARASAALAASGHHATTHIVPAGEGAKAIDRYAALCGELCAAGIDRSSAIVALGGGVVGDLAGFVAATLLRGLPVVQVPTTLLAMIDSAIGGKTGVNLPAGKNLVGAFWQPSLVLCDPELLVTLPARERRAALGELLKYALLDGDEAWQRVVAVAPGLAATPSTIPLAELCWLIARAVAIKAAIVSADEREVRGERALLNLGHTVGHAIEAASGFALHHGEAVALGLLAAARVSATLGLAEVSLERQIAAVLASAGLDTDLDPWLRPDVLSRIGVDKKRTGSALQFVTIARPGGAAVTTLELAWLVEFLRRKPPVWYDPSGGTP